MTRQGGYLQVSFSGKQIAGWKVKETLNILVGQWSAFLFMWMPIPSFNLRYIIVKYCLCWELIKVTIESHPSHFISCNLAYLQHKLSTGWTNYSRWLITSCQLGCFSHPHFTLAHTGVLDRGEARARDARASRPPSAPRLTWLLSMLKNHFLFRKISFWF